MATSKKFLKGFANLNVFTDIQDELDAYGTLSEDARHALSGAVSCTVTDNKTAASISGDDDPNWYTENVWATTDLEVTVHEMELATLADILGVSMGDDGVLEEGAFDESHTFALTFSALKSDMGYRMYRYHSCQLMSYSVAHKTRAATTEAQDYVLKIQAKPRRIDGKIRSTKDAAKGESLSWLEDIDKLPAALGA